MLALRPTDPCGLARSRWRPERPRLATPAAIVASRAARARARAALAASEARWAR